MSEPEDESFIDKRKNFQKISPVTNKFQIFIEHKLLEKKLGITNFSRMVEKQFKLEKQLNEMIDNIRSLKLRIIEHKKSYILAKQDDIV